MVNIKGTVLNSAVNFIKTFYGIPEYTDVLKAMKPEFRKEVSGNILASHWYPIEMLHEIHSVIASKHPEDKQIHFKMGVFSAEQSLRGVYRIFLKVGNLGYIMSKSATVWSLNYSEGKMELIDRQKDSVVVKISDFPAVNQAFSERLLGYMFKVGDLSGEKIYEYGIKEQTSDSCTLFFKW